MLLELAVGDAWGAGFEYSPEPFVKANNNLKNYAQHQRHKDLRPGQYTDDTQMSIAIAEALLDFKKNPDCWTPLHLANKFVECFKRDKRSGYAARFYDFLCEIQSGEEFLEKIRPNSNKSGGAMRVCPIGFIGNIDDVISMATIQCKITHNTEDGIAASVAAALTAHYCIFNLGKKEDIFKFINNYVPNKIKLWKDKVGGEGLESVSAAITAYSRNNKLSDLLMDCVNFTGDVDTVAAIAMACASESVEYEKDIPNNLLENLEQGEFGLDFLEKLNNKLVEELLLF